VVTLASGMHLLFDVELADREAGAAGRQVQKLAALDRCHLLHTLPKPAFLEPETNSQNSVTDSKVLEFRDGL
jgi:hypothetical protein